MPIYAYRCSTCGHAQDVLQRMSDPLLAVCPACAATTYEKQLTAAGFQLKGSGWYVTDFRDGNTGAKKDDKKDDKAADGAGDAAGDKAADKVAAKPGEKAADKPADPPAEKRADKGADKKPAASAAAAPAAPAAPTASASSSTPPSAGS